MRMSLDPTAPVDMHVHIVGNGLAGSGCELKMSVWRRPLASFMLQHIQLSTPLESPEFDRAYVEHLLRLIRESSLSAAVILAHDHVHDSRGQVMKSVDSLYVPNDYVLRLAAENPEFIPAVSIHPARRDALEELDRCLTLGARIMKCLPNCHNIDCNDPQYRPFWTRMAEAKLPLLAHTGGEHTLPIVAPKLADPRVLRLPLECGVTVIAAHCATRSGMLDREYIDVFLQMLKEHPNLHGDTSALNLPIRSRRARQLRAPEAAARLTHGSDFPVPIFSHWAWMWGLISWRDFRRTAKIPNVLERDYQIKRALGFGPEHFTRIHGLLRPIPAAAASAI